MRFLTDADFNFVGRRSAAALVSLAAIALGIGSLVVHQGPRYSIDFTGGSLIQVQFQDAVAVEDIRSVLSDAGFPRAEIQRFGADNEALIRVPLTGDTEMNSRIKDGLRDRWPDLESRREETVGPKIGGELRDAALMAVLWALLGILVYVSWRFELRFALAAILALVHDILITLGVFSLMDREVSLAVVAAFLTIVGYSLNDTIVVFDRIRENLRVPSRKDYSGILNRSVNQSLSRTVITSGTTLVVTLVLFLFGGEVLRDFAFALTVGVVVGTYSSIFVATPVLVEWEKRRPRRPS
ncbi:MAG: protein translocase subunit SecF [Gemmatimonadota bacterium]|jgi:preprotein translocase subunit SecF|nr:protein translocase subunit SecF [Gemmatimonadota bacterium]MDP6529739.1 protein translocase subunit SecF [Gemmatimonadota bacterium]MDP6803639.1 protein translocase subunit SecF [Gemmatimonadota bacterium]MDP7030917.1 protein translocase subunit SecF [Gemmatimonadota bacterium]